MTPHCCAREQSVNTRSLCTGLRPDLCTGMPRKRLMLCTGVKHLCTGVEHLCTGVHACAQTCAHVFHTCAQGGSHFRPVHRSGISFLTCAQVCPVMARTNTRSVHSSVHAGTAPCTGVHRPVHSCAQVIFTRFCSLFAKLF